MADFKINNITFFIAFHFKQKIKIFMNVIWNQYAFVWPILKFLKYYQMTDIFDGEGGVEKYVFEYKT